MIAPKKTQSDEVLTGLTRQWQKYQCHFS